MIEGALIPFCIESSAVCARAEGRRDGAANIDLWINCSPSLASIIGDADSDGITSGLRPMRLVRGPKSARYKITVSIISPYIELATDGKNRRWHRLASDRRGARQGWPARHTVRWQARRVKCRSRMPPGR